MVIRGSLINERPFRAPHHNALRQPMEDGKVTIARVKNTHLFPANFMLVAAMNPCP